MIDVKGLVKCFGERRAVDDVTFSVARGEVLGFLGPNGAGKSTTMRMITGYLPPTAGAVTVGGCNVAEQPVAARRQLGYLPENAPAYGDMTVEEFLRFIAEMRGFAGAARAERVNAVIERCLLENVRRQTIETLSKGYRQRTCFAQAILHDPPALILDEPTEGLDPNQKHVVREMIRQMGREKVIILSTHILEEVEAICTRALVISGGKLVADAPPAELKRRSARHNATVFSLPVAAAAALPVIRAWNGVARVETLADDGASCRLRAYAQDRTPLLDIILTGCRAQGWSPTDVLVEEGRLDEVFRS